MTRMESISVTRVLLASPRGYCAGVERAIHQFDRLLFVLTHDKERRRRADAAEVTAAESQA